MTLVLEDFDAGNSKASLHKHHATDAYRRLSALLTAAHTALVRMGRSDAEQERFRRWFGEYTPASKAVVSNKVKAIHRAVVNREITFCKEATGKYPNVYAYVYPELDQAKVYLCDIFFTSGRHGRDSAVGTIIHELSHIVAQTDDHRYGEIGCRALAIESPVLARENADSYQYFCESFA